MHSNIRFKSHQEEYFKSHNLLLGLAKPIVDIFIRKYEIYSPISRWPIGDNLLKRVFLHFVP